MTGVYGCLHGEIEIEGVSLHIGGAWWVLSGMAAVLAGTVLARGDNVAIPGVPGTLELPKIGDERTYSLLMEFAGDNEPDGTPYEDPYTGLQLNLAAFQAAVCLPADGSVTSRAATFTAPDGSIRTANVQPVLMVSDHAESFVSAVLDLTIPKGAFEATGS